MDAAEVNRLISRLEQDIGQCLEDGVKQYKVLMDCLQESKQPLTDSQLLHFHQRNVQIIKEVLDQTFKEIMKIPEANISHKIEQLLNKAKLQLDTHADQYFKDNYRKEYEIQIDGIRKKVKEFTALAEMFYDEKAGQSFPPGIPKKEVLIAHEGWAADAVKLFENCLAKINIESQDFWKLELIQRLKECEEYLIEEYDLTSSSLDQTAGVSHLNTPKVAHISLTTETLSEAEITQMLELVKQDLLQCIKEGLDSYAAFMESLFEPNQPLTDSQIFQYHSNIVQTITNAVDASYTDTNGIDFIEITSKIGHLVTHDKSLEKITNNSVPNISQQIEQLFSNAKHELEVQTTKQFNTFVINHFVLMERSKNLVNDLSLEAIKYYDEHLQQRLSLEISLGEIIMTHWTWEQKAINLLDQLLLENNFEETIFWKHDLANMLQERLKELIFKMDPISTNSDPCSHITYMLELVKEDLLHCMKEGWVSYTAFMESLLETNQPLTESQIFEYHSNIVDAITNAVDVAYTDSNEVINNDEILSKIGHLVNEAKTGLNNLLVKHYHTTVLGKHEIQNEGIIEKVKLFDECVAESSIGSQDFWSFELNDRLKERELEFDVGIYFGENSFEIGIYNPNFNDLEQFEKVMSTTAEICFLNHQPYVVLGHEAHSYANQVMSNNRYFDLCKLITTPNEIGHNPFKIRNKSYTLCTHQIMAIFLKLVLDPLHEKYGKKIGNAVFTIPFTPTSATKERLQRSAEIVGLKKSNIRILSTLSTLAIVALKTESKNNDAGFLGAKDSHFLTKQVLVLDVQRNYFSIGVVELSPAKVTVKSAYGSANLVPPSDELFSQLHSSLYSGLPLSFKYDAEVRQVYRDAVSYVLSHTKGLKSLASLVVSENKSIHILKLVQQFVQVFKNFTKISVCSPLKGASILALSTSKHTKKTSHLLLPPSLTGIQVHETSRFDLLLDIGKNGQMHEKFVRMGERFTGSNDQVFNSRYHLNETSVIIELHEVCGTSKYEVSRHLVSKKYSDTPSSGPRNVENRPVLNINGSQDADGVYSLKADSPYYPYTDQQRKDVSCGCQNSNWGGFKEFMKLCKKAAATTSYQ